MSKSKRKYSFESKRMNLQSKSKLNVFDLNLKENSRYFVSDYNLIPNCRYLMKEKCGYYYIILKLNNYICRTF
jgi:hypothetical protein